MLKSNAALYTFSGMFGKNMSNRHCSRCLWEGWSQSSTYGIKCTVRVYQMLFEILKLKWKLNSWPFYIKWIVFLEKIVLNYTKYTWNTQVNCTNMYVPEPKWKGCKLVGLNLNSSFSLVKIFTQQIKPFSLFLFSNQNKVSLGSGEHFSHDVLPSWDDRGSCAHKYVC